MNRLPVLLAAAALAACGVETAGTAATSAEIKKRELQAGQKSLEQAKEKIDRAAEQIQQRAGQAGGEGK